MTIAIGKLGQLLLEYTLKRPGLKRNVIMWCFDDLLTTMAPVAATTATPDEKLQMMTPSPFACGIVRVLEIDRVIFMGIMAGLIKGLIRQWWSFPTVVLVEAVVVGWFAYDSREHFDDCWTRWKVLLPERSDDIESMESFWRAYLQTRPNFTVTAADGGRDGNYAVRFRVLPPWVPASECYTVHYRMQPSLLSTELVTWKDRPTRELQSHSAFQKHVASDQDIIIDGLEMGSVYDFRVDAILNRGGSVVRGTVVSCTTGHPRVTITEDDEVPGLVHVSSNMKWSGVVNLRYRQGRWPWRYRESILSMSSPEFLLNNDGACQFKGLTAGSVVRVEFRCVNETFPPRNFRVLTQKLCQLLVVSVGTQKKDSRLIGWQPNLPRSSSRLCLFKLELQLFLGHPVMIRTR